MTQMKSRLAFTYNRDRMHGYTFCQPRREYIPIGSTTAEPAPRARRMLWASLLLTD